jgi:hypothetical protein
MEGKTPTMPEGNEGQDYEEWRLMHTEELRVSVDIRAAPAACESALALRLWWQPGDCFGNWSGR